MRIAKNDIPIKVEAPGAVARQMANFGDATGYGTISAEHYRMAAGTDMTPLLEGLENDLCHAPHWGYLIKGRLTIVLADGAEEEVGSEDMFYWPPGHTLRVSEDAEFVVFSPQREHGLVLDHINRKLRG